MSAAELKIENDRLKTTLMILNQKMKLHEDSEDMNAKWRSQLESKEAQIQIMNDQILSMQNENDKQRMKMKKQHTELASLESEVQSLTSKTKQLMSNLETSEEERELA
jgi:ribosomal protein L24